MNIKNVLISIGVFICIVLIGWLFVLIMSSRTWMVDKMDYLLWAIIYASGVMGVCTFTICNCIKKNRTK